ncbi:UNVERIFIED_CONTAM: hypothetical protein K2H54_060491, partial [Gekko kuhli]
AQVAGSEVVTITHIAWAAGFQWWQLLSMLHKDGGEEPQLCIMSQVQSWLLQMKD